MYSVEQGDEMLTLSSMEKQMVESYLKASDFNIAV